MPISDLLPDLLPDPLCPHAARVRASDVLPVPVRAAQRVGSIEWHPAEELRDRRVRD